MPKENNQEKKESFDAVLPIPTDFQTHCKYENNTSLCGRWYTMFSQALHMAMGA